MNNYIQVNTFIQVHSMPSAILSQKKKKKKKNYHCPCRYLEVDVLVPVLVEGIEEAPGKGGCEGRGQEGGEGVGVQPPTGGRALQGPIALLQLKDFAFIH